MSRIHCLSLAVLAFAALAAAYSPADAQLSFTYNTFNAPGQDSAVGSLAGGISASGNIAGTYLATDGAIKSYIRQNGIFTDIVYPGSSDTEVWAGGVNDAGYVSGSSYKTDAQGLRRPQIFFTTTADFPAP